MYFFSSLDAFVTIIKCNVGTGMLALPLAFNKAGYGVGIYVMSCIVSVHTLTHQDV